MTKKTVKNYDVLVFIGRFQPFHIAHKAIIQRALDEAERVIVLIGSAKVARSQRNPFTWQERSEMIYGAFPEEERKRLYVSPVLDQKYNDNAWIRNIQVAVQGHLWDFPKKDKVGLIGHSKDHSSYYLKMFPQWSSHINVEKEYEVDATDVRKMLFSVDRPVSSSEQSYLSMADLIPQSTADFLARFEETQEYRRLRDEYMVIEKYKKSWAGSPYAPTFVTTDAVVVQSGHILLVQRGAAPGKGLWALPGGFLGESEKLEDSMIRELREETVLKVPDPVIRGSIKKKEVFDDPFRSERGRTVTHAFLVELRGDEKGLPKVKGSDDAQYAAWVPISALEPELMFEDHFEIVQNMLGESLAQIRPSLSAYGRYQSEGTEE